jgi:hypothetical protein
VSLPLPRRTSSSTASVAGLAIMALNPRTSPRYWTAATGRHPWEHPPPPWAQTSHRKCPLSCVNRRAPSTVRVQESGVHVQYTSPTTQSTGCAPSVSGAPQRHCSLHLQMVPVLKPWNLRPGAWRARSSARQARPGKNHAWKWGLGTPAPTQGSRFKSSGSGVMPRILNRRSWNPDSLYRQNPSGGWGRHRRSSGARSSRFNLR